MHSYNSRTATRRQSAISKTRQEGQLTRNRTFNGCRVAEQEAAGSRIATFRPPRLKRPGYISYS